MAKRRLAVLAVLAFGGSFGSLSTFVGCSSFGGDPVTSPDASANGDGSDDAIGGEGRSLTISAARVAVIDGEKAEVVVKIDRKGALAGDIRVEILGLPPELTSAAINVPVTATEAKLEIAAALNAKHGDRKGITVRAVAVGQEASAPLDVLLRGKAGSFDTSFGEDGALEVTFVESSRASAATITNEGDIVVATTIFTNNGNAFAAHALRLKSDGTPDPNFGSAGVSVGMLALSPNGVVSLPDGRVVLCGRREPSFAPAMTSFSKIGLVDTSFANGALATYLAPGQTSGGFADCAVTPAGAIVAVGSSPALSVRVLGDGKVDPTYQTNGYQTEALVAQETSAALTATRVRPDGRVLSVGTSSSPNNTNTLVHLSTPQTGLDATFGANGRLIGDNQVFGPRLALAADGSAFVSYTKALIATVTKIVPSGKTDTSFGALGVATLQAFDLSIVKGIVLDAEGRAVIVGQNFMPGTGQEVVGIGRFQKDGKPDTSFAPSGSIVRRPKIKGVEKPFLPEGVALQGGDRVLIAGSTVAGLKSSIGVLRLWL